MEKIIETTDLYDVVEFTVQEKRIKYPAVLEKVNEYLIRHSIADQQYKATSVERNGGVGSGVVAHLSRCDGTEIDEDFADDPDWEAFCGELAKELGVRYFSVPSYYYPK